jgi:hypothetical protein
MHRLGAIRHESFGLVARECGNGAVIAGTDGPTSGKFDRGGGREKSRGERTQKKDVIKRRAKPECV